jgi:hypothetical protein
LTTQRGRKIKIGSEAGGRLVRSEAFVVKLASG